MSQDTAQIRHKECMFSHGDYVFAVSILLAFICMPFAADREAVNTHMRCERKLFDADITLRRHRRRQPKQSEGVNTVAMH